MESKPNPNDFARPMPFASHLNYLCALHLHLARNACATKPLKVAFPLAGIGSLRTIRNVETDKVATGGYFFFMKAAGIKSLKNKLSEYVKLAASGETVLVTERDKVVAELTPLRPGRSQFLSDAMLAEVVRKGWITPPLNARITAPRGIPVAELSEILSELNYDRGDR